MFSTHLARHAHALHAVAPTHGEDPCESSPEEAYAPQPAMHAGNRLPRRIMFVTCSWSRSSIRLTTMLPVVIHGSDARWECASKQKTSSSTYDCPFLRTGTICGVPRHPAPVTPRHRWLISNVLYRSDAGAKRSLSTQALHTTRHAHHIHYQQHALQHHADVVEVYAPQHAVQRGEAPSGVEITAAADVLPR